MSLWNDYLPRRVQGQGTDRRGTDLLPLAESEPLAQLATLAPGLGQELVRVSPRNPCCVSEFTSPAG